MISFFGLERKARKDLKKMGPAIDAMNALGIELNGKMGSEDTSQTVVSYPPIGAATVDNVSEFLRLAEIKGPTTLYIQIPFCPRHCSYCGYNSRVVGNSLNKSNDGTLLSSGVGKHATEVIAYLKQVETEITLWRQRNGGDPIPVESIYIGGGTPTVLNTAMLKHVFELVKNNFILSDGGEFTLETSPGTASFEKFFLARQYGVNRASMGVQSFNPDILRAMNRSEDIHEIDRAIVNMREAGVRSIDIDMMRGHPLQTPQHLIKDLEGVQRAYELGLASVTSYQYMLKPNSVDQKRYGDFAFNKNTLLLHQMFIRGAEQIGLRHQTPLVDWFVKGPEYVYRQQIQKWMGRIDMIGIGPDAYGNIGNYQYYNHSLPSRCDLEKSNLYEGAIASGALPVAKVAKVSYDESLRRDAIFGIKGFLDRQKFTEVHGVDVMDTSFGEEINALIGAGALEKTSSIIRMTPAGVLFASEVQKYLFSSALKPSRFLSAAEAKDATMARWMLKALAF